MGIPKKEQYRHRVGLDHLKFVRLREQAVNIILVLHTVNNAELLAVDVRDLGAVGVRDLGAAVRTPCLGVWSCMLAGPWEVGAALVNLVALPPNPAKRFYAIGTSVLRASELGIHIFRCPQVCSRRAAHA